jgi:hypothetical protein
VEQPVVVTKLSSATKVNFDNNSSVLTASAKKSLLAFVAKIKAQAAGAKDLTITVVGYTQPTTGGKSDSVLSTARAKSVADFLKAKGLKATYKVSGAGRASVKSAAARYAQITVNWTK